MGRIRRMVVKVGGDLFLNDESKVYLANLVNQIGTLIKEFGIQVLVISSGAINSCIKEIGRRPKGIVEKQAFAAIGQIILVNSWRELFKKHSIKAAQALLIYDDLDSLRRRKRALNTLNKLIKLGAVPIINENDTTAVEEIRWGDNDPLAVMVAELVDADLLALLTDVDGFYGEDNRPIPEIKKVTPEIRKLAKTEDMRIKIKEAGGFTERNKKPAFIANWQDERVLLKIVSGKPVGTKFLPTNNKSKMEV